MKTLKILFDEKTEKPVLAVKDEKYHLYSVGLNSFLNLTDTDILEYILINCEVRLKANELEDLNYKRIEFNRYSTVTDTNGLKEIDVFEYLANFVDKGDKKIQSSIAVENGEALRGVFKKLSDPTKEYKELNVILEELQAESSELEEYYERQ